MRQRGYLYNDPLSFAADNRSSVFFLRDESTGDGKDKPRTGGEGDTSSHGIAIISYGSHKFIFCDETNESSSTTRTAAIYLRPFSCFTSLHSSGNASTSVIRRPLPNPMVQHIFFDSCLVVLLPPPTMTVAASKEADALLVSMRRRYQCMAPLWIRSVNQRLSLVYLPTPNSPLQQMCTKTYM